MLFNFTNQEKIAIVKVAVMMEGADGDCDIRETIVNWRTFEQLKITSENIEAAKKMSTLEAFSIIGNMLPSEKEFVAAFLGSLIMADHDVDDRELTLWRFISSMCQLPTMDIKEALDKFLKAVDE